MWENVKNLQNHFVGRGFHSEAKPWKTFHCALPRDLSRKQTFNGNFCIDISVNIAKSSRHGKSRRSEIKGKETLRLKSNGGKAAIEIDDENTTTLIAKVNELLEAFIGIDDLELGNLTETSRVVA